MEHEIKLKEAFYTFYNRINSKNLNAAIIAHANSACEPGPVTLSPHFINRVIRAGGYDFNLHLHPAKNSGDNDLAARRKHT